MNTKSKYLYLKLHEVTRGLTDVQILKMAEFAKLKNINKRESIYMADSFESRIYLLVKGKIKISEVDDRGVELIKEVLTATDIFGDIGLNGGISNDEFAESFTDNTIICSFNSADFKMLLASISLLAINFVQQISIKFRRLESRHSSLVFKDAKSRLINFFKDWAIREGNKEGDKIKVNNYLTHNDIACIISTSRQSVTTFLNELKVGGVLFYDRKYIEFNDRHFVN